MRGISSILPGGLWVNFKNKRISPRVEEESAVLEAQKGKGRSRQQNMQPELWFLVSAQELRL